MLQSAGLPLLGHSGANLALVERDQRVVVRKGARAPAQNTRLRAQCVKLRWAREIGLSCPLVISEGEENGLFFFEMEYIPGESLANAITAGRELRWEPLCAQLRSLVDFFRISECGFILPEAFSEKILQVAKRCRDIDSAKPVLHRLEIIVERLLAMDWSEFPKSDCHGDLTLENVLIREDGTMVFIDFDVPEQSSWLLDVGKLYQDLLGHWCLRQLAAQDADGMEMVNAQMRLADTARHLNVEIEALIPGRQRRICQIAAFHLLRAVPYTVDTRLAGYIADRLESLIGRT